MTLPISPKGRRYGAARSRPDHRDYGSPFHMTGVALPPSTSNAVYCGAVKDQGDQGSCTAHGTCSQREYLARRYQNLQVTLSPAFVYYMERKVEGTLDQGDCGAGVRTSVAVMQQYGACTLAEEPYDQADFSTPPTQQQLTQALAYRGGAYHRLSVVTEMKQCMASGYGFVIGFNVYDSFESDEMAKTGLMPVPNKSTEAQLGGHEVFAIDYDDSVVCPGAHPGALKIQNSWGTGWGQSGFFWMPYQVAADQDVLTDAFIEHLGRPWG